MAVDREWEDAAGKLLTWATGEKPGGPAPEIPPPADPEGDDLDRQLAQAEAESPV